MHEIPECLKRRYKALDELIKDLSTYGATHPDLNASSDDPEIKLMCEFWNILKEDPDVNLKQAVQQRMGLSSNNSGLFGKGVECYMAGCCQKNNTKKPESPNKTRNVPVHSCKTGSEGTKTPQKGLTSRDSTRSISPKADQPLHKVLCNLKEAASFEKKCQGKVNELLENQKHLQDQITGLEQKERDGAQLLKQADCMWSCMEESYKRKIAESLERQKGLLKQLKEVEASNKKWRNNKKDLDFQLNNVTKCHQEIVEQINEKTNDVKCIEMEIESFKNRIESDKKDLDIAQKSMVNKKKASDGRLATIALQVTKLENILKEEKKIKETKEAEGREYIKEARNDLQKLCKVLLQKKLENEDMRAEKEALLLEIEMLKQTCDQCREKCKNKQESLIDEIKTIDKEIAEFKVRCIRCHQCVDTGDVRSLCTDCPRCLNERECLVDGDHCSPDHTMDCVCATVKQKFLDNVFDNMYTLLERQIKTGPGKAVAEAVMDCLKKSKNGKINDQTKKILQDFILTSVKKNLKLTIIGGAVKTRCEMDSETYKQLMLCLKEVKVTKPPKVDRGTDSKKDPCKRWGGPSECNCPKGPKACVCIGKGLLPTSETQTCPPQSEPEDDANVISCPYRENGSCGVECAARAPVDVGREVAAWKPDPCQGPSCQFRNMRAAQCVLGPEVLASISGKGFINSFDASSPRMSGKQATCKCSGTPTIPCVCHKDTKQLKANMSGMCDQSCADVEKSLDSRDNQESNKHIKFKNANVENKLDVPIKYVQVDVRDNNNRSDSSSILKSNANNLKIALNQKLIALLESKMEEKKILPLKFKNGENGELLVDFQTDDSMSEGEARILAKKSPSGNIFLEIEKNEQINKQRSNGYANSTNTNTKDGKEDSRETDENCASKIFQVKVIGTPELNEKDEFFALKSTRSGNFEIVLDKEFEKWYKETVKNQEGEDDEYYMRLKRTDSGNYVLNVEDNNESTLHSKNALLVKSDSGNIKVIVNEAAKSPMKKESFSKSILSPKTFKDLLQKLPASCKELQMENIKKSHLRPQKSISDSGLYGRTKFDLQNEQYFPSDNTPVLNMTSSGEFTVTLNKEAKKSFINNLKNYLSTSSKGLVPIRRSVSGVIYVDLSSSNNLSNYGTVKITPSGNIYITLDNQLGFAKEIFGNNKNRKMDGENQSSQYKRMSPYKESDSQKCQNCDKSKRCDCKKMRDKANNWCSKRSVDGSSETHPDNTFFAEIIEIHGVFIDHL
ncbi:uncharacterized protein LOC116769660 [Danaus plexippus]|uniref:uncharacterized protein LOC116769660 n=1 Tax=Danaus plexippus TaxID=13037 RepID=UPI002AB3187D|nr:uncharacterized protein LOC116769660 [Danaus plexippus]